MIESIKDTSVYKSLNLNNLTQAYLFYSSDKELNDNLALVFAKSLLCENQTNCNKCSNCIQFNSNSHPELTIINQKIIKVDDANNIISKLSTKPIIGEKKVFVILNADTMTEIVQNKLLKSFEEPNEYNIFILTTTKIDKLLPTLLSRMNKKYVPKLSIDDKKIISSELLKNGIDITNQIFLDFSLTEMINYNCNQEYIETLNVIKTMLYNLNNSSDIPKVSSEVIVNNKELFFQIFMQVMIAGLKKDYSKFEVEIIDFVSISYPQNALIKIIQLIEDSYKKFSANVNFYYVLDNLLFNILKEKFLCK